MVFLATGIGYLLVPGLMLSVVGIESGATTDFLIRTEGVALLFGGACLWAMRDGGRGRIVLLALGAYYVVGSLIDLDAYQAGIVGTPAVPSAAARIALGALCVLAAMRSSTDRS